MSELRETIGVPNPMASPNKGAPSADGRAGVAQRSRAVAAAGQAGQFSRQTSQRWLPWGLTAIAMATAAAFGWRAYRLAPAGANPSAAEPIRRRRVWRCGQKRRRSFVVSRPPIERHPSDGPAAAAGDVVLDSKGYLIAAHQIQLSPQVGGEIIWLDPNFKEGAVYKKGDRLAEIDPVLFAAQLDSANAALRVAQTNLTQVETGSTLQDIEAAKDMLKNLAAKLELSKIDDHYFIAAGFAVTQHDKDKAAAQVRVDQIRLRGAEKTRSSNSKHRSKSSDSWPRPKCSRRKPPCSRLKNN